MEKRSRDMNPRALRWPLFVLLLVGVFAAASANDSLEDRIGRLESQMRQINAQLGKLDHIKNSLQAVRQDDLQKLQRALLGASESVTPNEQKELAEESAGGEAGSAAAEEKGDPRKTNKVLVEVEPRSPERSKAIASGSPEERTSALEQMVAAMERRYADIDTIAEQLHLIRNEDLPKLNRSLRGVTETVKKIGPKVAKDPSSVVVPAKEKQVLGTIIVNNATTTAYRVAVNDQSHLMVPGRTTLKVPYGPVRTRLVDFEVDRNWPLSQWKKVNGRYELILDLKN
jgi:hypothetical protein